MIKIQNIQPNEITLKIEPQGGGSPSSVSVAGFGFTQITEAEYTQNPDYYNLLVQQGAIAMTTNSNFHDVADEPAQNGLPAQKGSAVSGVSG